MSFHSLKVALCVTICICFSLVASEELQHVFAVNCSKLIAYIVENKYSCEIISVYSSRKESLSYDKYMPGEINSFLKERLVLNLDVFTDDKIYLSSLEGFIAFGLYWESLDPRNKWCGHSNSKPHANHFAMKL